MNDDDAPVQCPQCGSETIIVGGYEDGGGDYGEGVTETLECLDCGCMFAGQTFGE